MNQPNSSLLRPSAPRRRPLDELFDDGVELPADAHRVSVSGITLDSRGVSEGDLYVALSGSRVHGARFAGQAAEQGAVAILTDAAGRDEAAASGLPVVVARDARDAMADAAATLFGLPTHELLMFGITGTNGKTTTCFLLEAALEAAGRRVGSIGTIGFRLEGKELPSDRTTVTTPESPDLQALLATMLERGADSVAMEVSSHALALQRVDHIGFDVAAFTNLGRDHLDFHPSIEDYFEAKARLFQAAHCRVAVVNIDDEHGRILASRLTDTGPVEAPMPRLVTTGFAESDHQLLEVRPQDGGTFVRCRGPYGERSFTIDLPGDYNARNAVMALAMATEAGLGADDAIEGLRHAQVSGRMQLVTLPGSRPDGRGAPRVHVDFAHTPQAIESALQAANPGSGQVVAVLGAGGDRDEAKRAPMGRAAAEGAGLVVVTDDNPRTEDPDQIRAAVVAGAREVPGVEVLEQAGRSRAIRVALQQAGPGDVVLVLGKGHEKGQIVGDQVHRFDDVEVVRQVWNALCLVGDEVPGDKTAGDQPAGEGEDAR